MSKTLQGHRKVHLYQALICSKVQKHWSSWSPTWIHWRLSIWGVTDRYLMYAGGLMCSSAPNAGCFNDLVCQPLVTSYVIDAYLCLATVHPWTLEYQHMMLCVWWWIPTKAESQWPAGEDRRFALAMSGWRFRRMPTLYCYLRCGDMRSPGITERRNGSFGLRDDDDDDDDDVGRKTCVKMEGKTNFSRHLQAVRNWDCWVFENHWRRV